MARILAENRGACARTADFPRIDTGGILAFVVRTDAHHNREVAFVKETLAAKHVFVLADLVFAEAMTLPKARAGSATALRVGEELRRNPIHLWAPLGPEGERETWALSRQCADKGWACATCTLLAL